VCSRRQWPEPRYEPFGDRAGYHCKVRVNNREYSTEVAYESPQLAMESAAMKAYMICRNFSANDGMVPGQRPGQGSGNGQIQGLPVAIGSGRRSTRDSIVSYDAGSSEGTNSGGNSPRSVESSLEQQLRQLSAQQMPMPMPQVQGSMYRPTAARPMPGYTCQCGRAPAGRCGYCHQSRTWA
jgi:hypothetical protein